MIRRLFFIVLVFVVLFLSYNIFMTASARVELANAPPGFSYGPPDADLNVVEFLYYDCDGCRKTHPVIMEAVKKDGKVRYTPLLVEAEGAKGNYAAKATYAAGLNGKYRQAYEYFINDFKPVDESSLGGLARELNVDAAQLKQAASSKDVEWTMTKNKMMFSALGGVYVPAFFIGPTIRYVPYEPATVEGFLELFRQARREAGNS